MNWDYLAGLIDGEGSLALCRGGCYRYRGERRPPTYRPQLTITNTHRGVLVAAQALTSGSLHERSIQPKATRPCYILHVSGHRRLIPVLEELVGRLIIKRLQAEIMLAFCRRRLVQATRPFTAEDYALVQAMRNANDRPIAKGSWHPLPA